MATRPLPEPVESRFAPYIKELHEYFTTSGVPFGSPEDFPAFAARLREPGPFADDLASLVRSFVLRQGGAMPHAELLEILSVAIAGPDLALAPQRYGDSLRQLLGFVSGVMRRPWNVPPGEPAEVVPFPSDTAARPAESSAPSETQAPVIPISAPAELASSEGPAFPVPIPTQDPLNPLPPEPVEPSPVPEPVPALVAEAAANREPMPAASAISAALAAESERHPHAFTDAAHPAAFPPPEPTLLHRPEAVSAANPASESAPPHGTNFRRRNLLLATAAVVLLAAAIVFALRSRQPDEVYNVQPVANSSPGPEIASQPAPAPVAPSSQAAQPVASGTSYPPKPSAYGPALTDRASRHARVQPVPRPDNPDIAEPYSSSPQYAPQRAFNQTTQPGAAQPSAGTPRNDGLIPRPQPSAPVTYAPYNPAGDADQTTQPAAPVVREPAPPRQAVLRDPDAAYAGEYPPGTQFRAPTSTGRTPSFTVSSGVMAANLISSPEPDYPMIARLAHIQGQVILQAVIAKDGTVSTTRVLRGNRLLRGAAEEAVRQWRYRPYKLNGRPVDVATIVTVDFHNGPTQ